MSRARLNRQLMRMRERLRVAWQVLDTSLSAWPQLESIEVSPRAARVLDGDGAVGGVVVSARC
jgi:hypothetical protein